MMIKMIFSEPDLAYGVVSSKELLFPVSRDFFRSYLDFFSILALGMAIQQGVPSRFGALPSRRIFQKTP